MCGSWYLVFRVLRGKTGAPRGVNNYMAVSETFGTVPTGTGNGRNFIEQSKSSTGVFRASTFPDSGATTVPLAEQNFYTVVIYAKNMTVTPGNGTPNFTLAAVLNFEKLWFRVVEVGE
jgi:hypothetical protein